MRILFISILIFFFFFNIPAFASIKAKDVKEGNTFYKSSQFDASAKKYSAALKEDPNSDIVNFNLGTALYKKGDYEKTIDHLNKSLLSSDKKLENRAHYNLGNTFYKFGMTKAQADLKGAVGLLEQALPHYESVLSQNPQDGDAKYNHEFVSKELERLKKKLEEEQKKQQEQKEGQEKKKEEQAQGQEQQAKPQETKEQNGKTKEGESQNIQQPQAQEQKGSEEKKEEKTSSAEQKGNEEKKKTQTAQGETAASEQPGAAEQNPLNLQELSTKEARRLLDNYQQSEEPKGLLNLKRQETATDEVEKDW